MGTRNLTVIIKDHKIRLSQYGQWDGYFGVSGRKFFRFVKHYMGIVSMKERVDRLRAVTPKFYEDNILSEYDKIKQKMFRKKIEIPFEVTLPQFSRDTGVDILEIVRHLDLQRAATKFPVYLEKDWQWCEFIYVLDFDTDSVYMLTNWEFEGEPESVPDIISKNYPLPCCYKSTIKDLPEVEEIEKILKTKRSDGFGCYD